MSSAWTHDPVTPHYADEVRNERRSVFQTPFKTQIGITEPGLAEIKPHKPAAIRKGLAQLRAYLQQRQGTVPELRSIWLITYLPWPLNTNSPAQVRIFAHKLKIDELMKKGPISGLDALILSRRELPKVALPPSIPFPSLAKPDMFGMAVEPLVRDRFSQVYQRPQTHQKPLGRHGPDVLWHELAYLLRELADETGDRYWGELADELIQNP